MSNGTRTLIGFVAMIIFLVAGWSIAGGWGLIVGIIASEVFASALDEYRKMRR